MAAPCCPPGSHGAAEPPAVQLRGATIRLGGPGDDGIEVYVVQPAEPNGKAVLVFHDIFGDESGRTKQVCDRFADNGFTVVMPSFFRLPALDSLAGPMSLWTRITMLPKMILHIRRFPWSRLKVLTDLVLGHMRKELGATSIGLMCYCWGFYPMSSLLAEQNDDIKCAVAYHPSAQINLLQFEGRTEPLSKITAPVLMLAAGNDPGDVKPGGLCAQTIPATGSEFKEYSTMRHGWVNRGDLEDEAIKESYDQAFAEGMEMYRRHL